MPGKAGSQSTGTAQGTPSCTKGKFRPETSNCVPKVPSRRALRSRMCIPTATLRSRQAGSGAHVLTPSDSLLSLIGDGERIPTTFVVDTGASITVLDGTFWEKANCEECSLEPWTGRRLVGVEGTPLHICGASNVELKFAGETFHCPVLVARSLTSEAILGLDFLEANNCTLEMADRKLTFPERGVAVSLCDSSPDPDLIQARVTVDETLTIPLFSMLETMARVNGKVQGQT